jgi:hypothetical protein
VSIEIKNQLLRLESVVRDILSELDAVHHNMFLTRLERRLVPIEQIYQ